MTTTRTKKSAGAETGSKRKTATRKRSAAAKAVRQRAETPQVPVEVDAAAIATEAYALWELKGWPQGQDVEIWLEAEERLRNGGARKSA